MHPRLLSTIVLIEPVILDEHVGGPGPALMATMRRDTWDSRAKAENSLRKAFGTWDIRSLTKFFDYGLRVNPTALQGQSRDKSTSPQAVTLTTSKHQEAWAYAQVNFEPKEAGLDRLLLPDWDDKLGLPNIAFRPESFTAMQNLPYIRPGVLYVFGAESPLSSPQLQDQKLARTGVSTGGNGGRAEGKVDKRIIQKSGHLVVMEQPRATANATATWIKKWFEQWLVDKRTIQEYKSKKSDNEMRQVSKAWIEAVKLPANAPRPRSSKL